MKKTITKKVTLCDECGREADWANVCRECGKEFCVDCDDTCGRSYAYGIHFSGSGDGFYCLACDAKLTMSGKDKLHSAYREIANLRKELEAWNADFRKRQEVAEARVKELL